MIKIIKNTKELFKTKRLFVLFIFLNLFFLRNTFAEEPTTKNFSIFEEIKIYFVCSFLKLESGLCRLEVQNSKPTLKTDNVIENKNIVYQPESTIPQPVYTIIERISEVVQQVVIPPKQNFFDATYLGGGSAQFNGFSGGIVGPAGPAGPAGSVVYATSSATSTFSWEIYGNHNATSGSVFGTMNDVDLKFIASSSEAMVLNTNGNLGIATSTPSEKLTVNGNILGNGHNAFGNMAQVNGGNIYDIPGAQVVLNIEELFNGVLNDGSAGISSFVRTNATVNNAGTLNGISSEVSTDVLSTANFTGDFSVFGGQVTHNGSGLMSSANGSSLIISQNGSGGINNAFGVNAGMVVLGGGGYSKCIYFFCKKPKHFCRVGYNTKQLWFIH